MIVWKYDESCSLGRELDPSEAFRGLNAKSGLSKLCISHPPPNRDPTPWLYPLQKIFQSEKFQILKEAILQQRPIIFLSYGKLSDSRAKSLFSLSQFRRRNWPHKKL